MLEAYKTNGIMRDRYLQMNSITHAEIWDSEDNQGNDYQLALCTADGVGFREGPTFATPGQVYGWVRNTCNCKELLIKA